ncbi:pyridoxine/pyridoxamine 5'-phosphate oxidase 2 isoform X2 [Ricinus communis]|uniref:pyridoxine/pyridoxamine 5'-phosphate oxidase 2 isoform X2 n=1 Tax=Ricinus communis TaxID=3988 RepID=UPI00201AE9DC|nr:pyridoxine/pyridoxamine 5'-phosphate oxidase 2 isoform X2 [Ricinus communis]
MAAQQDQPAMQNRNESEKTMAVTATAPWKQLLLSALESNSHLRHSSFFQLATIGSDGRPSNRTVVFSDKIQINTDSRTRKTEELKQCSFAEICWYFTDSWEQFRINGRVDVIDGSDPDPVKLELREKSWFASSIKSRLQYLGPNPGLPCLTEQHPSELFLDPSSGPVAAFCLLVLDPEQVDYLNLKSSQRTIFTIGQRVNGENSWNSESINP